LFTEYIIDTKFAAVASLVKGQFVPAMEILQDGILSLILSSKEGQHFDPMKA